MIGGRTLVLVALAAAFLATVEIAARFVAKRMRDAPPERRFRAVARLAIVPIAVLIIAVLAFVAFDPTPMRIASLALDLAALVVVTPGALAFAALRVRGLVSGSFVFRDAFASMAQGVALQAFLWGIAILSGIAGVAVFATVPFVRAHVGLGVAVVICASVLGAVLATLAFPLLMRIVTNARPAPAPMRALLDELAATADVRYGALWVLPSPDGACNALITGLTPARAQIFVTQTFVEALDANEQRAVLVHELGHLALKHGRGALLAACGGIGAYAAAFALIGALLRPYSGDSPLAVMIAGTGAYVISSLGVVLPLSRGRERAADTFARRLMGTECYGEALQRLYRLNLDDGERLAVENLFATHPSLAVRK